MIEMEYLMLIEANDDYDCDNYVGCGCCLEVISADSMNHAIEQVENKILDDRERWSSILKSTKDFITNIQVLEVSSNFQIDKEKLKQKILEQMNMKFSEKEEEYERQEYERYKKKFG